MIDTNVIDFTDPVEAELIDREGCRRFLVPYLERFTTEVTYEAEWFHKQVAAAIEQFEKDVEAKKSPRLMIFAPPRHGKSQIVSRCGPTWMLGRHPNWNIGVLSYGQELSDDMGRWGKQTVSSDEWRCLFPKCRIRDDSKSVSRFDTTDRGGCRYMGMDTTINGRGFRVLIVDDPIKNREDADSEVKRKKLKATWSSDIRTRLAPGGGIIVMHTRWHEDDLAGYLLGEMANGGEQWKVLNFPAIAEEKERFRKIGDPLCPGLYDLEALHALRKALTPRDWLALYQQRPAAPEGFFFKTSMICQLPSSRMPVMTRLYQAWDLALTPAQANKGDYSVGACMGVDSLGRYWLVDIVRGRWSPDQVAKEVLKFWRKHEAQRIWLEGGAGYLAMLPALVREQKLSHTWIPQEPISHEGKKKDVRATNIRGVINGGNLYVPAGATWWKEFVEELIPFPAGKHDDQVDAIAYLGLMLPSMMVNKFDPKSRKLSPVEERSQVAKASFEKRKKEIEAALKGRASLRW